MMMVVADAILVSSGRVRGLDAPDEAFLNEQPERVVHSLSRDGADLNANILSDVVGRAVGMI